MDFIVLILALIFVLLSPITPETVAHDMPMPTCKYTIRKDELDGEILRYAKVGDQVVHRWECDSKMYGMLVHSCYVEDGQGEKRMVIDERGYAYIRSGLGDPTYTEDLNLAYRESYVFKFADRVGVRFSCEIKLCVKEDGGCAAIVPPNCGHNYQEDLDNSISKTLLDSEHPANNNNNNGSSEAEEGLDKSRQKRRISKRRAVSDRQNASLASSSGSPVTATADLISQYVYVLDSVEGAEEAGRLDSPASLLSPSSISAQHYKTPICLSSSMFAAILVTVALAFAFTTVLILHILYRHLRPKEIPTDGSVQGRVNPSSLVFK